MKNFKKTAAVILAIGLVLTACSNKSGNAGNQNGNAEQQNEVTKLKIGVRQDYTGISYINEDGELVGYDIDIMKLIDEALPQYEFEYDPVGQEALLIGLDTNQYVAGVGGYFYNEDRASKYLYPENYLGGSLAVLLIRDEDKEKIENLEDLYDAGGKLVPISPIDGTYGIVLQYNEANPDKKIELVSTEWGALTTENINTYLVEKVYDAYVSLLAGYQYSVEQGIDFTGLAVSEPFSFVPSYTLFAKGQESFMAEYDRELKKLIDSGKVSEISKKWHDIDIFALEQ